jgi:hypothetical protein
MPGLTFPKQRFGVRIEMVMPTKVEMASVRFTAWRLTGATIDVAVAGHLG